MENSMSRIEDNAPATIKEVGIHLAYMQKDVAELTRLVQELPNGFAKNEALLRLEARVKLLEAEDGSWWTRFGIPTVWTLVGAIMLALVLSFLDRLK